MSDEQGELRSKIEQAEAAATQAEQVYSEAEPGACKDKCFQLLLKKGKAVEQLRAKELLQLHAAAGVNKNHC